MAMVTRRGIEEAVTPLILGVYALTGITFNGIATFSFNHWDYSLTSALAQFGGIEISLAALIGLTVPVAVYVVNNNRPGDFDTQSLIALFPAIMVGLMILSPPIKDFVVGSMYAGTAVFAIEMIVVAFVAGPNDLPEIPGLSEVTGA